MPGNSGKAGDLLPANPDPSSVKLGLSSRHGVAIVPSSLSSMERYRLKSREDAKLARWVRGTLVGITVGIGVVFAIALWIRPYDQDGRALLLGTHRQIGLPPCSFYAWTKLPCPSCGMTTSFALLARGDVWNSLKANAVGTLLAGFCLALVPWSLASAARGRFFFVGSLERALTRLVIAFLVLLLCRWLIVLALTISK